MAPHFRDKTLDTVLDERFPVSRQHFAIVAGQMAPRRAMAPEILLSANSRTVGPPSGSPSYDRRTPSPFCHHYRHPLASSFLTKSPGTTTVSLTYSPIGVSALGRRTGLGATPSDLRIYSPETGSLGRRFGHVRRRSQPAPTARCIPAGRQRTRPGAGGGGGRRRLRQPTEPAWAAVVAGARATGSTMARRHAAHVLVVALYGVLEPVGLPFRGTRPGPPDHDEAPLRLEPAILPGHAPVTYASRLRTCWRGPSAIRD